MFQHQSWAWITMVVAVTSLPALGQDRFDAGSDGSYGAINVTEGEVALDIPVDGVFHCTTINVATDATLRFNRNANNTPVYLLANGDITIDGTLDISGGRGDTTRGGQSGPGGFDGGTPGFNTFTPRRGPRTWRGAGRAD